MNIEWINQYFDEVDGFPRPNWDAIYSYVDANLSNTDQQELWCKIALTWMDQVKSKLSSKYALHETDNFIIVTSESEKYVSIYKAFLENTLKKILSTLQGIASDDGFGKYVVLIFDEIDTYYSYMSHFYPEDGEYGLSSGIYINKGYGHFAFPHQEAYIAEAITAHEMTHALVSHLPLPVWLDEGMAVTIQDFITGFSSTGMDADLFKRHSSFWGEDEIQEFWSGDSFFRPDEGQELSYHLAQLAVKSLSHDYDAFINFVNKAHFSDGGEAAANDVYGVSIGNIITRFFGDGLWEPMPNTWKQ